ncbi:hypothetical protein E5S67_06262 [Microcoleus sp. IPMA8]|uniref:Uncharacterized protein n=1 Tax=Microcoleus asticus IPMA8 TaxID=2563858 RepID=A0ABX2D934_9CYAN|nr:hypothetical protein [Microcoleus asticus IPMA8]
MCENFDRIEVSSIYMTVAGLVTLKAMFLDNCIAQDYQFVVITEESHEETLLTWQFLSAFF